MAYLFEVEGKKVVPNTETLVIEPFKTIWERDEMEGKQKAIREFAYIEFMSSVKESNPYKGYSKIRRDSKIRTDFFHDEVDWEPDEYIIRGMEKLEEFQKEASSTYTYWKSAKKGAEKLQEFFLNFNLNERKENGTPVYKPKDITNALKDSEDVLSKLNKLEEKVEKEIFEKVKSKEGRKKSPFSDPDFQNV